MSRLIVVSNRLPVSVQKQGESLSLSPSPGGLATGLDSLDKPEERIWIGWPAINREELDKEKKAYLDDRLEEMNCRAVHLSRKDVSEYYYGFSNKTLWPLFHYFPLTTVYEQSYWQAYKKVNEKFLKAVRETASSGDTIWIHDYQLMLLPKLLRSELPDATIGFFLHIPYPSYELFRLLPWRREILEGLLGSDLLGFHTYDYARHFLSSVTRILGIEHSMGELMLGDRLIRVDTFPMGIDFDKYSTAHQVEDIASEARSVRENFGDTQIILSVDRLDYTKGIPERLTAFDSLLSKYPSYRGKITLILLVVPSRTGVLEYRELRDDLDRMISRINGHYGTIEWTPIHYLYRSLPFPKLSALYLAADVALVTPLRDGMNLVAKEFVASKTDGNGVLILSEMAGAASEMGEALIVNSNDKQAIVQALRQALEMPQEEKQERMKSIQRRLARYTIQYWAGDFLTTLEELKSRQGSMTLRKLTPQLNQTINQKYREAGKRLLFLDYDGTLVNFVDRPEDARPDEELLIVLEKLSGPPENEVVIISGRDKDTLEKWMGKLPLSIVAEHGGWIKTRDKDWHPAHSLRQEWKDLLRPIMELFADRTPGSSVEEKDFALVWHCRRSEPEQAKIRMHELRNALTNMTENLDIGVFEGSKILEVKKLWINKGAAAELWLENRSWDFIFAAGDDYTDEDLFSALPEESYSIKVGNGMSKARYYVDSVGDIREVLTRLAEATSE